MDLITFVQETIGGGIAGGAAYDGLKMILGNSYEKLSSYLQKNETAKFEAALDMLLSKNMELREKIERLQNGENIAGDKIDKSVSIGGNSSGTIITGDGNIVNS